MCPTNKTDNINIIYYIINEERHGVGEAVGMRTEYPEPVIHVL